jgi:hypothetical protein
MESLCTVLKTSLMHPEATQEAVVVEVEVEVLVVVVEVLAEVVVAPTLEEVQEAQTLQKEETRLRNQATSKRA